MIVIATHNGKGYLIDLLSDIKSFNIPNEKVCVVDNMSTKEEHLEYLEDLKREGYNILYNPRSTYEIGAFKYAVDTLKDDVWFGMQDSTRLKQDIFSYVIPRLTDKNIYTFLTFTCGIYDWPEGRTFMQMKYGTTQYSKGTWASSIFALDSVIQRTKEDWLIPINKFEAGVSERAISIVLDRHGIEIIGLGLYDPNIPQDKDFYPFFRKVYGGRQ